MKRSDRLLTWQRLSPTVGPTFYRGYLGKVQVFYIGTVGSAREHTRYLSSTLFPKAKQLNAAGSQILMDAAEDYIRQSLNDMGVTPFE